MMDLRKLSVAFRWLSGLACWRFLARRVDGARGRMSRLRRP